MIYGYIICIMKMPVFFSSLSGLTPDFPPDWVSECGITIYLPAPFGGRMSEGQEGGFLITIYNILTGQF